MDIIAIILAAVFTFFVVCYVMDNWEVILFSIGGLLVFIGGPISLIYLVVT